MGDEVVEDFDPTSGRLLGALAIVIAATTVAIGVVDREAGFPAWVIAVAALGGVLAWTTMLRPRLSVTASDVVMRNSFGTVYIPLAAVEQIAVRQVVAVWAGEKRYISPAVGKSWRKSLLGNRGTKEQTPETTYAVFVEERLCQLTEQARATRGITLLSDEQQELAAGVRQEPAWPEIGVTAAGVLFLLGSLLLAVLG